MGFLRAPYNFYNLLKTKNAQLLCINPLHTKIVTLKFEKLDKFINTLSTDMKTILINHL